jgi:hypothetical protein
VALQKVPGTFVSTCPPAKEPGTFLWHIPLNILDDNGPRIEINHQSLRPKQLSPD